MFELCRQRRPCAADLPVVVGQTALGEAAGRTEMFRARGRLTRAAGLAVCAAGLCASSEMPVAAFAHTCSSFQQTPPELLSSPPPAPLIAADADAALSFVLFLLPLLREVVGW